MRAEKLITIFIMDDQVLFRLGLRNRLEETEDIKVEGECDVGEDAIELVHTLTPGVVLLGTTPQRRKGLDLARCLVQRCPNTSVVLMTSLPEEAELFEAIRSGVSAYVGKQVTGEELIALIRRVDRGDFPLSESLLTYPQVAERVLLEFQMLARSDNLNGLSAPLSPREMEVLQLIRDGYLNKEIAQRLCLTEQTIKCHVTSILRKLEVNDRTQAVLTAVRQGWISLERGGSIESISYSARRNHESAHCG